MPVMLRTRLPDARPLPAEGPLGRAAGTPVYAINVGRTRADPELVLRVAEPCEAVLPCLAAMR